MSAVTFYSIVSIDRDMVTLSDLDNLIETLRERGFPVYEPSENRIVTEYTLSEWDGEDFQEVTDRAAEEMLPPTTSYHTRVYGLLVLEMRNLFDEVNTQVASEGHGYPVWTFDRP